MSSSSGMEKLEQRLQAPREPASCWEIMQPEFVDYIEGEKLTCAFPVQHIFTNPRGSMQGGFIGAAFDNTVGALLYIETGSQTMASVDLNINYQRPIFENDKLVVSAYLKSMGKSIAHFYAEALDGQGRLVATATTNIMLLDKDKFIRKD